MVGGIRLPRVDELDRGLAWALVGFVLYVAAGPATLFAIAAASDALLRPLGLAAEPGSTSWGLYLASQPLAWGITTAMLAGWLGRRLIPGLATEASGPILVLGLGLALAATTTFALHEWVRARYELFDPEYAGPVIFAAPALVAVALGGWATLAMPRHLRRPVESLLLAATTGFVIATLPTLGGLTDGLAVSSRPLAMVLGLDGLFVLALVVTSLLTGRDG